MRNTRKDPFSVFGVIRKARKWLQSKAQSVAPHERDPEQNPGLNVREMCPECGADCLECHLHGPNLKSICHGAEDVHSCRACRACLVAKARSGMPGWAVKDICGYCQSRKICRGWNELDGEPVTPAYRRSGKRQDRTKTAVHMRSGNKKKTG